MKEDIETKELESVAENDLMIVFTKPFFFEGGEYDHVDLSGMEDMTTEDLVNVERAFRKREGEAFVVLEANLDYYLWVAAEAAKLPVEFFLALPMKEGKKVRNCVRGFMND